MLNTAIEQHDDTRLFEEALMHKLEKGAFERSSLREISGSIMELKRAGLVIDQVFPKGRLRYDGVLINGKVDPMFWSKFASLGGKFKRFEVFPMGIINPEVFGFKAHIGL